MLAAVEVHDLRYRFPDGTEALRGVTCSIEEGASVGLIGPNGAGKSTLLLHLNGLLPERATTNDGTVSVFGRRVTAASANELRHVRREVGLVFQDPNDQLFCPTVWEDVAFGPRQLGLSEKEVAARVAESLAQVGLTGFDQRATHHLSAGEQRRACIAGVLACRPRVLILDEPTSDLDPRGRREVKALLQQVPITKIIATHDLEMVVELCPHVIVMDAGAVVAAGPTVPLLSDEPLMLQHGLERPHILLHHHPHGTVLLP